MINETIQQLFAATQNKEFSRPVADMIDRLADECRFAVFHARRYLHKENVAFRKIRKSAFYFAQRFSLRSRDFAANFGDRRYWHERNFQVVR